MIILPGQADAKELIEIVVQTMERKKVLVLGATGGTGQQLVSQAIALGHDVTVMIRNPAALLFPTEGLRVVVGSVTGDASLLATAVRGQDAVVSVLGAGSSLKSNGLMASSVPAIIQAMETERVRRLIMTSAFGVGVTRRDTPFLARLFIRVLLRDIYADKQASEEVLLRSSLDWTLVYPTALNDGPRTGQYRVGERLKLHGMPKISRANVADFLLTQVVDASFVRKQLLISE